MDDIAAGGKDFPPAPEPLEKLPRSQPEFCRHGWHDGKSGHVCYLPADHEPPHKCSYCGAKTD